MRRLLTIGLPVGMALAGLATLGGAGSGTAGRVNGRCVVLYGDAYPPSKCDAPGAVAAETEVRGATGAIGYGAVLTPAQVKDLWIAHGGDPAQADVAQAVAGAESGRNPNAVLVNDGGRGTDRGLFQINSVHGECSTFDLDRNVQCAVDLQRTQGWRPWVTYNSGAHRKYLGATA